MQSKKKATLHPKNPHKGRYDLKRLSIKVPLLKKYIVETPNGALSIDFSRAEAVYYLNQALLLSYYDLVHWNIPAGYLCPPVPGRADYIHYAADLLANADSPANVLDIGTGANGIYPIIGSHAYNWSFVGSELDDNAIQNLRNIIGKNDRLKDSFKVRKQHNPSKILEGVIEADDYFDLVICNPPFYSSKEEAEASNLQKVTKLSKGKRTENNLNFGGNSNELWYPGGEKRFISQMVNESKQFEKQVHWFSTLVAKSAHLKPLQNSLDYHNAAEVKVIEMGQGNKISRILAWKF